MGDFEKRTAEIEQLTQALEGVRDGHARAAAEALVRAVMELHGDAFGRIVEIARRHGALDALAGTPIFEDNGPETFKGIDIMRTVRSFDPCLPCGVHMYLGDGKELAVRHAPMFGVQPPEEP